MQPRPVLLRIAVACAYALASAARADGSVGGSLAATSDYIFHGLSQSDGNPALQADVHYRSDSGAATAENFIGLWSSTISRATTGSSFEVNAYAGRTFLLPAQSSTTLSYVHYAYPDEHGTPRYDYDELASTWAFEDRVFFTAAWTPDSGRYSGREVGLCCRLLSYDVTVHQSLGHAFTLSAALGYDEFKGGRGYAYWNGGVAHAIGPLQLDVSYFAMQPRAVYIYGDAMAGSRWVGSVIWHF